MRVDLTSEWNRRVICVKIKTRALLRGLEEVGQLLHDGCHLLYVAGQFNTLWSWSANICCQPSGVAASYLGLYERPGYEARGFGRLGITVEGKQNNLWSSIPTTSFYVINLMYTAYHKCLIRVVCNTYWHAWVTVQFADTELYGVCLLCTKTSSL